MHKNDQADSHANQEASNSAINRYIRRKRLIEEKLDPTAEWVDRRHLYTDHGNQKRFGVEVKRQFVDGKPRVFKSLNGFMSRLQKHEFSTYFDVWIEREKLSRVATFDMLSGTQEKNVMILKDYGPSLADWLTIIGPQRLHPDFVDYGRPLKNSPLGPWLNPSALLSLTRALLEALEPFHRQGFVHCDVKEDNFCIGFRHAVSNPKGAILEGEIDLDSLTAIDLGCGLKPARSNREIHFTSDEGAPIYICSTYRSQYIWPALMRGSERQDQASQAARCYAEGGYPRQLNTRAHRQIRQKMQQKQEKPVNWNYVSDNYLLACEMAVLGEKAALEQLDWRIDFFSLGQLLRNIMGNLTNEGRELEGVPPDQVEYLQALPEKLQKFDTCPLELPPELPHPRIIEEINGLIGRDNFRRLPFVVNTEANPIPWYEIPQESPFSVLFSGAATELNCRPPAIETALRPTNSDPSRSLNEFCDFPSAPLLISIPAGSGWIGSPPEEAGRMEGELMPQLVKFRSFALGKYPVTFAEWDHFVRETGYHAAMPISDETWGRDRRPLININWHDAMAYLAWLNSVSGWQEDDPHRYRLPTAQEWEYAARAGTRTPYYTGETLLPSQARFYLIDEEMEGTPGLQPSQTVPVGSFEPNPWRLHDMLGNVWEWVEYSDSEKKGLAMIKGGSWLNGPQFLRAACCKYYPINKRSSHVGLRVARSLG